MKSALVKLFGFPATLIHGDTLVLDRWVWLRRNLPVVPMGTKTLLDIGCGNGAFTVGAAKRGYRSLGLSWDERNQRVARERAEICRASLAEFEVMDVRCLDRRPDLNQRFDVVICFENIEHILDDQKLMCDMARCLKGGGVLLLTTPNFLHKPISAEDDDVFLPIEDGRHVRRGYTPEGLECLCAVAGLSVVEIGFCSGMASQKVTSIFRKASEVHPLFGFALTLPLRLIPPLLDGWLSKQVNWPDYCVTLKATGNKLNAETVLGAS